MNLTLRKTIYSFLALLIYSNLYAQIFSTKNYPQNYFQWPVGAKIGIAANFGELRPNHYHMGLDCKTDQKGNVPVYAAADGYVAKVTIDATGFGRAIYINHPNGLTTLYAHLNDFNDKLENYVESQQYSLKKWKVTLEFPAQLFPVKKGDFIAFSGNTGGSQGPHVHFEIRDTKSDKVLNPLLFGLPISDNVAPDIIRLALYDRNRSTYEHTPRYISIRKINNSYQTTPATINVGSDKISFAITAFDRYTGSTNQNGIYGAAVLLDNKLLSRFEMDSISYDETRYLNAHIDYKTKNTGGPFLQHLSMLPGYEDGIYKNTPGEDGVIILKDTLDHQIGIVVRDADGNTSTLDFKIKYVNSKNSADVVYDDRPMFKPSMVNVFENSNVAFYMPEKCLYDSFHFNYKEMKSASGNNIYQLHNDYVPVQCNFPVKIKGDFENADTGKIVMKVNALGKEKYQKANFNNGMYKAEFRDFGTYQLLLDRTPPIVTPLFGFRDGANLSKQSRIGFSATDDSKDIAEFTALLDGQWLLFTNDKAKNFYYKFDKYCPSGEHTLELVVKDLVGNTTTKTYRFVR